MPIHPSAGEQSIRNGVLITRPEPGASETAKRIVALGFEPIVAPVLAVTGRALPPLGEPQAVLVTSGNALPALPASLYGTKLLAVGDATAARARAAGFTDVLSAGKDAEALAELAASVCNPRDGTLLLASGAGQGLALATALRGRGFKVRRVVAYAAKPITEFSVAVRKALDAGGLRAALFFSPETARVFMTIFQRDMAAALVQGIDALAISKAAALPLPKLPWRRIQIAAHPTQDELLALLS